MIGVKEKKKKKKNKNHHLKIEGYFLTNVDRMSSSSSSDNDDK
jgi:hypothetical protein